MVFDRGTDVVKCKQSNQQDVGGGGIGAIRALVNARRLNLVCESVAPKYANWCGRRVVEDKSGTYKQPWGGGWSKEKQQNQSIN